MHLSSGRHKKIAIGICAALILIGAGVFAFEKHSAPSADPFSPSPLTSLGSPELSGWVAYWDEPAAYALLDSKAADFHIVSPYWYEVDDSFSLKNVSATTTDRVATAKRLESEGLKVVPLVNTQLEFDKLSPLFTSAHVDAFIAALISELQSIGAQGGDIDLEEISPADKSAYIAFLSKLRDALHAHNMLLAVTTLAQTGDASIDGQGTQGVDLAKVGAIADRVNILAFDLHGQGTEAGPIATLEWLDSILKFSRANVPKDKIVIGLPQYGYDWHLPDTKPDGYSYAQFMSLIGGDPSFASVRDAASAELKLTAPGQAAWVADSESLKAYISAAQKSGVNRFDIWLLGGMDEKFFDNER